MKAIRSRIRSVRDVLAADRTLLGVLKNSGWLTGSSGAVLMLSVVQGVLTARLLGVTRWGILGIALSFAVVVGKLLSFRMNDFVVRWVTQLRVQDETVAPTAFRLALLTDTGTALVSFFVVQALAGWAAVALARSPGSLWVFRLVALFALFQAGRESFQGMLHLTGDFRVHGLILAGCQAVSVTGIVLVSVLGGGMPAVASSIVLAEGLACLLFWVFGLRAAGRLLGAGWLTAPRAELGDLRRPMLHFAVMTNISGTLRSTMNDGDLLLLGLLAGPASAAYYKLAKSICQIAQLPNLPMVNASYPEFSAAAAKEDWVVFRRLMARGSSVAAVWVVPVSVALVALSPFAIRLLYGPSFLPAVPVLALLLAGLCFDGVLFWTSAAMLSLGQPGYHTGVNLGVTGAKLGLAFLLVPAGGHIALAAIQCGVAASMNLVIARRVYSTIRRREGAARPERRPWPGLRGEWDRLT